MGHRAIFQGTSRSKLPKFAQIVLEKKHIFMHKKKSMRQNFEIKYKKIGFIVYFKKIERKHKVTELVFLLQVKNENFPICPIRIWYYKS